MLMVVTYFIRILKEHTNNTNNIFFCNQRTEKWQSSIIKDQINEEADKIKKGQSFSMAWAFHLLGIRYTNTEIIVVHYY